MLKKNNQECPSGYRNFEEGIYETIVMRFVSYIDVFDAKLIEKSKNIPFSETELYILFHMF